MESYKRVLNRSPRPLHLDPNKLNKYFPTTTERTLGTKADDISDLLNFVDSLSKQCGLKFSLMQVTSNQVINENKELRSDCSAGADHVPLKFIKLVANDLVSLLTRIINTCIDTLPFPSLWKIARISPIPKVDQPTVENYDRPVYHLSRKYSRD